MTMNDMVPLRSLYMLAPRVSQIQMAVPEALSEKGKRRSRLVGQVESDFIPAFPVSPSFQAGQGQRQLSRILHPRIVPRQPPDITERSYQPHRKEQHHPPLNYITQVRPGEQYPPAG